MKISINITDEDLRGILTCAVEGNGIGYWAEHKDYNYKKGTVTVREHNNEDDVNKRGPWHKVTRKTIARGLTLCANAPVDNGGWIFGTWHKDRTGDANTADVIFQFGVLGELKYG